MRFKFIRYILFLVVCTATLAQANTGPQKWAVVVGVDNYQKTSVTDLRYAVTDAKLFAEALTEVAGFSPERVFLYTTDAQTTASRPLLTNLIYRLETLKKEVKPEDSVYFYFAGHGVEMEGATFLLTENSDNRSRATLTLSALPADLLLALLEDCKAKDTLVVLDACRNDPMAGRGSGDNRMSDSMSRGLVFESQVVGANTERSVATMLACGVGERSYEWPEKKHGYFTYHLVQGLKSKASNEEGQVNLAGLSKYVREQVKKDAGKAGHQQQPSLRYEGPGPENWVLAKTFGTRNTSDELKSEANSEMMKLRKENAELRAKNAELEQKLRERTPEPNPSHL